METESNPRPKIQLWHPTFKGVVEEVAEEDKDAWLTQGWRADNPHGETSEPQEAPSPNSPFVSNPATEEE